MISFFMLSAIWGCTWCPFTSPLSRKESKHFLSHQHEQNCSDVSNLNSATIPAGMNFAVSRYLCPITHVKATATTVQDIDQKQAKMEI